MLLTRLLLLAVTTSIDWNATAVLGQLFVLVGLLIRMLFGASRKAQDANSEALKGTHVRLDSIAGSLRRFDDRLLILEQWRITMDQFRQEQVRDHTKLSDALTRIQVDIAAIRARQGDST